MKDVQKLLKGKIPSPETGIEIRKSICAICDPGPLCGLDLYIKDGKIIKVEGNEKHPSNAGSLCPKGAATRQYVYHEDRLKTPLKRSGPRGSGKFEPISWDEALDTIASKFNAFKKEYGPESVVFFSGYTKYFRPYLKRLAHLSFTQLFNRVQHLPPGLLNGPDTGIRPARRTGPDEHPVPAGLEC
jgi:anaerobic selenocysteine-containing dehydrogenase